LAGGAEDEEALLEDALLEESETATSTVIPTDVVVTTSSVVPSTVVTTEVVPSTVVTTEVVPSTPPETTEVVTTALPETTEVVTTALPETTEVVTTVEGMTSVVTTIPEGTPTLSEASLKVPTPTVLAIAVSQPDESSSIFDTPAEPASEEEEDNTPLPELGGAGGGQAWFSYLIFGTMVTILSCLLFFLRTRQS
jgi:hypothetical protein